MAAVWTLEIQEKDVATKRVTVVGVLTDGEDVKRYGPIDALIATSQQKTDVLNTLWAMYEADVANQTAINTMLGDLATAGAAILNGRMV